MRAIGAKSFSGMAGYLQRVAGLYETFYLDTVANIRRWIEQSSMG